MIKQTILFTLLYGLLLIAAILHHEIWSDEAHHFLLAAASNSAGELFYNCRYEGHPPLWNMLLFVLTRFTGNVFYMQILNALIAITSAFLIFRYAPFTFITRLGIAFGYFGFFEFGVISRNYALLFLLMICYCILFTRKPSAQPLKLVLLLLLSFTHLFGLFAAVAFFIADLSSRRNGIRSFKWLDLVFIAVIIFIVYAFVIPPADHMLTVIYNNAGPLSVERIKKVIGIPLKAFFHFPDFLNSNLWNKDFLISHFPVAGSVISLCLVSVPFFLFKKNQQALIIFYLTFFLMALFIYFSPIKAAPRHCSILMLVFISCCWMNAGKPGPETAGSLKVLNVFLFFQFVACLIIVHADYNRPFSNGKAVAGYLKNNTPANSIIAMSNQGSGAAISAYLGKELYYPEKNGFGSFASWNTVPFIIPDNSVYERLSRLKDTSGIFLVMNHVPENIPGNYKLLKAFENSIVSSENYFVYKVGKSLGS